MRCLQDFYDEYHTEFEIISRKLLHNLKLLKKIPKKKRGIRCVN